jgi:predicted RNA binding protein YcfA (HicA-like mRNA interferase family)
MPKLKVLSGAEVLRILNQFGFVSESQRGSHVKVRRVLPSGVRQSLTTVPLHREIDLGTLMAIYRQAIRFISPEDLHDHFFG